LAFVFPVLSGLWQKDIYSFRERYDILMGNRRYPVNRILSAHFIPKKEEIEPFLKCLEDLDLERHGVP